MVELKAVSVLANEHRAQVVNYLNASGCQVGVSSSISGTIRSSNMNASPTPECLASVENGLFRNLD